MLTRDFILAGNAIFTVSSPELGHRTYRVCKVEFGDGGDPFWFAKLLSGPDNTRDYSYLGRVRPETGKLTTTRKSPEGIESSEAWKYLAGVLMAVWIGEDLDGIEVAHAGKCGRCGRLLTDPVSLELGLGPICRGAL